MPYYTSNNGTLLYGSIVCDPTTMFLFGLDSICNSEISDDSIIIPNHPAIADSVIKHFSYRKELSLISKTDEFIKYRCRALKHLITTLSGTDANRSVPIIWRSSETASLTDPDYLLSILDDAGYTLKDSITSSLSPDEIKSKLSNSNTYKKIDYKSMYQYALGVLYGCVLNGYSEDVVFSNTDAWYSGDLNTLISTSVKVFNFTNYEVTNIIKDSILLDSYKGVKDNTIWNFDYSKLSDSAFVYDAVSGSSTKVLDDPTNKYFVLDNTRFSYDDFYSEA